MVGGLGIEIIAVRLAQQMRFETFTYWTYFSLYDSNAGSAKPNLNNNLITSRFKLPGFCIK
jgi:hypothetical protein